MPLPQMQALARRIADAGVAVTILPATDLFLMGRHQTHDIRRGVADAHALLACGVNCALATNNILNPFTPFGDGSLVRAGNLQANIAQRGEADDLAAIFAMLTDRPARLMNLPDYGLAVGNPADIVLLDADSASQTIAELRPPLAAWKRGRRTLTRPRPTLHPPQDS
jgi:cytosine deaminase